MSEGNGYVGADFFLAPFERRYRDVQLPGGRKARIQNLSELEKVGYEQKMFDVEKGRMRPESRVYLVHLCLVDDKGDRVFKPGSWNDELRGKMMAGDGGVWNILQDACQEHCALTKDGIEQLKSDFQRAAVSEPSSV